MYPGYVDAVRFFLSQLHVSLLYHFNVNNCHWYPGSQDRVPLVNNLCSLLSNLSLQSAQLNSTFELTTDRP
jgi:hypothetical protein